MILLRDAIAIETSPEQVFDWLAHFCVHYRDWHPDHVSCRYVKGAALEVGSVLYVEEYLHGKLHKLTLRITHVVPNASLEYKLAFGMRGRFSVQPRAQSVLFVAELAFGWRIPVLGGLLDAVMRLLLTGRLEALRQHMAEEGRNLKRLLEKTP